MYLPGGQTPSQASAATEIPYFPGGQSAQVELPLPLPVADWDCSLLEYFPRTHKEQLARDGARKAEEKRPGGQEAQREERAGAYFPPTQPKQEFVPVSS